MRTVYQYIRPKLSRIGLTMVIKVAGTVIELYLPWLLSSILDDCAAVGDIQGAWVRGGLMVLCSLLKADRLSAGELGELLCLSPSNTSKVIRSAEEKGLVGRVYGDRDRRQMYFSLTEKGRRLISSVRCEDVEMPPLLGCIIKDIPSD